MWSPEATGTAWISLEQNIIDTDVNEWRKRLLACVHIVVQHFKQFYCRQFKNGRLGELSAKVSEMSAKCVLRAMLIKQSYRIRQKVIFRWLYFPQVVQKQTLGEVEN